MWLNGPDLVRIWHMTEWSWPGQDLTYDWMVLTWSGSDRLNVCLKRRNLFIRTGRVAIAEWFVIRQRVGRIKTESFSHSLLPRSNMWVRKRKGWFPVGRRLRLAWWLGSLTSSWRLVIRFCLAANRSFMIRSLSGISGSLLNWRQWVRISPDQHYCKTHRGLW